MPIYSSSLSTPLNAFFSVQKELKLDLSLAISKDRGSTKRPTPKECLLKIRIVGQKHLRPRTSKSKALKSSSTNQPMNNPFALQFRTQAEWAKPKQGSNLPMYLGDLWPFASKGVEFRGHPLTTEFLYLPDASSHRSLDLFETKPIGMLSTPKSTSKRQRCKTKGATKRMYLRFGTMVAEGEATPRDYLQWTDRPIQSAAIEP
jgi:hypothetical protein